MPYTSARCPLCGKMDSINHIVLGCLNPTMNGMHTKRPHVGLSSLRKGRYGSSLIGMDACRNERLLEHGIEVPENVSHTIPDWVVPNGIGSSARHHSRPDAVFVRSIPGRPTHLNPTKIAPHKREIQLVEFKLCPDTDPSYTLKAATAQHASTLTKLKKC
eukprot:1156222-Pelagomonas_calceolata.AAC.2